MKQGRAEFRGNKLDERQLTSVRKNSFNSSVVKLFFGAVLFFAVTEIALFCYYSGNLIIYVQNEVVDQNLNIEVEMALADSVFFRASQFGKGLVAVEAGKMNHFGFNKLTVKRSDKKNQISFRRITPLVTWIVVNIHSDTTVLKEYYLPPLLQ